MKSIGVLIAFLAALVFVLPSLTAQDEKKDADKADKKTEEKKDDKKDPDKKDPDKKEEKKAVEKLVYGSKFVTKVMSIKPESNRELSIEVKEVDPKKVYDNNVWATQRQQALAKTLYGIQTQKDFKQRYNSMINYQKDVANFQNEMAKRGQNIYLSKTVEVQAAEMCKVRAMVPPLEFDDQGFEKKYTKKELDEMRDKTGLPGFPVDFDAVKSGQYVEIYMAKTAKKAAPKKKGPDDDDPPEVKTRPEFVLIVILPGGPR